MLYIVCEDSKMGYDLWRAVNKYLLNGEAKVVTSFGITNMVSTIKQLSLKNSDKLFCAIDMIQDEESFKVLYWLDENMSDIGCEYRTTNYSCVEDVFISFEYLDKWITTLSLKDREMLNIARTIVKNRNSVSYNNSLLKNSVLRSYYPTVSTDEQMSAKIIYDITRSTGFVVSKSRLGRCWTVQCKCERQYPEYCKAKNCGVFYYNLNDWLTSEGKIRVLWNKSILAKESLNLMISRRHQK